MFACLPAVHCDRRSTPCCRCSTHKGGQIGNNDDSGGPDSYLRFAVPADGEYIAVVRDHLKAGGPNYVYRVEITEVQPELTLIVPERQQYVSTTLTIPKANRMAMLVGAAAGQLRRNSQFDVRESAAGGDGRNIAHGSRSHRRARCVYGGMLSPIRPARCWTSLANRPTPMWRLWVTSSSATMLMRGQNNTDVWGHDADRLATVLSEEIPFKIDIVAPKAPLVRNGSMNLKVVATRAEDFTAPINLQLLYNPPGIASSGAVTIPEGQTKASSRSQPTARRHWELGRSSSWPGRRTSSPNWKKVAGVDAGRASNARRSWPSSPWPISTTNFQFERTAVEQGQGNRAIGESGQETADFEGEATAELLGIPAGVTTEPVKFTKDTPSWCSR